MFADIALRQALAHGNPAPPPAPSKKQQKAYKIIK